MKKASLSVLIAGLMTLPTIGMSNDFSTVSRVQFVMDCIQLNEGKMNVYEAVHKCSCVIDTLATSFSEREFEDANTGFQLQNLPGDRGGMFRDDTDVTDGIRSFKQLHADAYDSCRIRR